MALPKLEELLSAGCHFGHLTRRWNPAMKPNIFMEKNGIHLINLKKTQSALGKAITAIEKIAASGESILFVGTKKQAQGVVIDEAKRSNNFYIAERWLGGTLTNFATVKKSIRKMQGLEKKAVDGTYDKITKKEILDIERKVAKMKLVLEGIAPMRRLPGAMIVADINKDLIAVKEAKKLGIPVFALADTNTDPAIVDYAIPANDDASKSISVVFKALNEAVINGSAKVKAKKAEKAEKAAAKKPRPKKVEETSTK
jgi:small subunit ribosomal protein S2